MAGKHDDAQPNPAPNLGAVNKPPRNIFYILWYTTSHMQIAQLYISPAVSAAGLDVRQFESDIKAYLNNQTSRVERKMENNLLSEQLLRLPINKMSPEVKKEVAELLSNLNNYIDYDQPEQNRRAHQKIDSYIENLRKPNIEDLPAKPRAMPAMALRPTVEMDPDVTGGRARKVSCGCRRGGKSRTGVLPSKLRSKSRTGGRRGRPRSKLRRGK